MCNCYQCPGVTVPVSPILLLEGHLHLLQAEVWEHQYCAGTALPYTRWTALGCGVFVSLCELDQVREGNAWKTVGPVLRFLSIEWFTPGTV